MEEYLSNAKKILKDKFKYENLRPLQENVVKETFNKTDIFVLSPTSSGKSLCFQLPALINEGLSVVISPLKSLIYDQALHLKQKKISTTFICSDVSISDKKEIYDGLDYNNLKFKLLYTTPETLYTNLELLEKLEQLHSNNLISRFVIDEAHCVSTWGHDFRPHYLKLNSIKQLFKKVPIMALTASATDKVQADIKDLLNMNDCKYFTQSFFRNNLNIKIIEKYDINSKNKKKESIANITSLVNNYKNETGIIYCHSRKECEDLSCKLNKNGLNCTFYHSGVTKKLRENIQSRWLLDDIKIIIATIAFGMGIDKPNVRFVIHFNLPQTVEGYYQEIGRAGRDGKQSDCILMNNKKDITLYNKMIDCDLKVCKSPKRREYNNQRKNKLNDIIRYVENIQDCKHYLLSTYFGEYIKNKVNFCNSNCINCIKNKKIKNIDFTEQSKNIINKIISLNKIGTTKKKILDEYPSKNRLLMERLITHLIINKYIKINTFKNKFGYWNEKLVLYRKAQDVLNDNIKIYLPMEIENSPKKLKIVKKLIKSNSDNSIIIEKLKRFRKEEALKKNIPFYRILTNKTLEEIATIQPKNLIELNKIKGIGDKTISNYGDSILNLI